MLLYRTQDKKITPDLIQRLKYTIEDVISKGVIDFYNGGACGWDLLCAETVIDLKAQHSSIKLHLLPPCSPEEQIKGWNKAHVSQLERSLQILCQVLLIKVVG